MNTHDFFNLLDGKIVPFFMKDGIFKYPQDFIDRYNDSVNKLNEIAMLVNSQLKAMTLLEQEQFKHIEKQRSKEPK